MSVIIKLFFFRTTLFLQIFRNISTFKFTNICLFLKTHPLIDLQQYRRHCRPAFNCVTLFVRNAGCWFCKCVTNNTSGKLIKFRAFRSRQSGRKKYTGCFSQILTQHTPKYTKNDIYPLDVFASIQYIERF